MKAFHEIPGRTSGAHPFRDAGPVALPGELELRNRAFCLSRAQRWAAWAVLLVPLVGLVLALLYLLMRSEGGAQGPLWEQLFGAGSELWSRLAEDAFQLGVFALTTALGLLAFYRGWRERVYVGPSGIRYWSGLPSWLGPLDRSFCVAADQIVDMRAAYGWLGGAPTLVQLVIETTGGIRRLFVFHYVDPVRYESARFRVLEGTNPRWEDVAELFDSMPLVEYARSRGFDPTPPESRASEATRGRSLAETPRLGLALLALILLVGYATVDMGIVSETYASGAPLLLIALGGAGFGALGWLLLGEREISRGARLALSGLLALAAMAALYPGLIRLNRIGAPDPMPHRYRHSEAWTLEPVAPTSPELDLPRLVDRLPGSEPGDVHELWIRRGRLGFDQIDIDALDRWIETLEERSGA